MARTQKNKATAHHLVLLKAKLAKLRRDLLAPPTKGGDAAAGEGFDVTKSGDSRVGLVGFPSLGKSTLLNKLTGTFSEVLAIFFLRVASYEFTTLTCIPGVITYLLPYLLGQSVVCGERCMICLLLIVLKLSPKK
ncbi:PREDICTED: developmentally-regulated G-protein 3-like isoform X2 [Brassica oleracea var. oleracea]|nr:PREDICTED: developmentally-regulated G-protein 3-like isoform X2 [Brassica oleracea var. oleracea]